MIRSLFLTARVLLVIAWLLLLICMLIPQARIVYYKTHPDLVNGMGVAVFAFIFALWEIISIITTRSAHSEMEVIFAIVLNVLLFIASPFTLIRLKASNLAYKSIYWILNVVCLILFVLAIPQILSSSDGLVIQLLPNLFLWVAAQLALTLSASARLLGEYIASRQKIAS